MRNRKKRQGRCGCECSCNVTKKDLLELETKLSNIDPKHLENLPPKIRAALKKFNQKKGGA